MSTSAPNGTTIKKPEKRFLVGIVGSTFALKFSEIFDEAGAKKAASQLYQAGTRDIAIAEIQLTTKTIEVELVAFRG